MPVMTDRRVRRTRAGLADALVELILERGYARITVQDILDRADIGRSTFYAHFRDKDALLESCFEGLQEELAANMAAMTPERASGAPARPTLALFEHAYEHRNVYRALCGRQGGPVARGRLHAIVSAALRGQLPAYLAEAGSPVPADLFTEHYVSGLLGVLTWWIRRDFPYPPAQIARMHGLMANPAVAAVLDQERASR